MQALTAKTMQALQPPPIGRIELSDGIQQGLKFRLTNHGVATWSLQMTINGRKRRFTIGPYPDISLSEARKRAARLRIEIIDGRDPVQERRKAIHGTDAVLTVRAAMSDYNRIHLQPNLRTGAERLRQLERCLGPFLSLPLAELTRAHLQRLLDDKAKSAPFAANRTRAALSAFIGWCWRRGYVESNFALATSKAAREIPRERVLTRNELASLWRASANMGPVWGPFLRLLLLTAQRRGDVANMEWSELDFEAMRWAIPGTKTKNGRPHIVHLSDEALGILRDLHATKPDTVRLVFTTTGSTPISGFGRMKERFDLASGVSDWRLHDIRTAFATHMADQGIDESVVDRVLNHVASASSASTVARVYNRAERLQCRAKALEGWASTFKADHDEWVQI